MKYKQTLDFLFSQLPMFHRIGAPAYKANLDNTIKLCKILGNPEKKFKSVHIAGTNGKGSVSHMLASVLQTAGYKTGLYTSPHLKDFRERIKIDGKKIPRSFVIDFIAKHKNTLIPVKPSFFEYTFGMAMRYFAEEKVDIAVIETGMGGRLDSTNVVDTILSVITNIGLDHMQFLGNTPESIAYEKAGIIKMNVPVVIGQTQDPLVNIFEDVAATNHADIFFADKSYKTINEKKINREPMRWQMDIYHDNDVFLKKLQCPLTGNYQLKNIITAIQTIEILRTRGFPIVKDEIKKGFKNVLKTTAFQGRWQILGKNPLIICDTGHNIDGIREVISQLEEIKYRTLHIVLGFVKDKQIDEILRLLPKNARYYFCKARIPRALNQDELFLLGKKFGFVGEPYKTVTDALNSAKQNAKADDLIFVGGSTFIVAEVLQGLRL